jgi:hypothetical protein
MTSNLPVSRLVNVGVNLAPQGAQAPSLSTVLVLGTSVVIDVVSRYRLYATLAAVAADFLTTSEEYLSAQAWFAQSPQPTSVGIGRWAKNAAAGQLICGPLSAANQAIGVWSGINNATLKLAVDGGVATNVAAIDLTAQTNLNGVASAIQAGIRLLGGAFAAVVVKYNASFTRFEITSGTTGATSSVSLLTASGVGTDISAQMNGQASPAYAANGIVAESALSATTLFDLQFGGQWYALFVPSAVDTDHVAVGSFVEGSTNPHFYWANSQEAQVLATGDTTHVGALLQALSLTHTAWQYSSTSLYAAMSAAARISTVNWTGQNTAITLMYKTEPGIAAETLNSTQIGALEGYNGNVYVNYANGSAILEPGVTPSGQFVDTVYGIDWLRGQIQTNVFNLLDTIATKVPQTDAGMNSIAAQIDAACAQGVTNGLLAPGTWNTGGFGTLKQGDFLDKGFYVFAPPVSSQTQAARNARQSVPFQVAAKLAGAVHTVAITVNVQQ